MEYVNCPICGQNNTEIIYKKASLNKDVINVICKNCALVFYKSATDKGGVWWFFMLKHFLSDKNKIKAEDVLPKLKTSDLVIKKTVVAFLDEFFLSGKNVLDVGCGFGALLDILKKRKKPQMSWALNWEIWMCKSRANILICLYSMVRSRIFPKIAAIMENLIW